MVNNTTKIYPNCVFNIHIIYFIQIRHMKFFLNKRQINYCYLQNNVSAPFSPMLNYLAREAKTGFKNLLYKGRDLL